MSGIKSSLCQVCSDPNAKPRYNSLVCNPCRVFFARHYAKSLSYRCDVSGKCEITYKKHRHNCTACRLKKCIEANMTITESCKGVVDALYISCNKYAPMKTLTAMYGGIMNKGFKIIGQLKDSQNVSEWVERLAHYDWQILSVGGKSPSSAVANTSMSVSDFIMLPGNCIDRSTASFDYLAGVHATIPYKLRESTCRLLVAAVENIAMIEEYHQLPADDRIRLLQRNGLMLNHYIFNYFQLLKTWDDNTRLQYITRFKTADGTAPLWNKITTILSVSSYLRVVELMKETQPTENEWMLLRIRSLFRPCPSMSTEGYAVAVQVRLKLTYCLAEYMREIYPYLTQQHLHKRLCKLLEIEQCMQNYEQIMYSVYQSIILQHSYELNVPLLHDIFIRQF